MLTAQRHAATAITVAISVAIDSALLLRAGEGKAEEIASAGALSFFADEEDARILLGRLNADPEIAFIVPDGPRVPPPNERLVVSPPRGDRPPTGLVSKVATCGWGWDGYWQRWRALRPVDGLRDGDHILWHISAGPLLISDDGPGRRGWRPDPWVGWTSERPVCEPNLMPAATIRLRLAARYVAYTPEERTTLRPLISYWIKGDRFAWWHRTSNGPGPRCNPAAPSRPQDGWPASKTGLVETLWHFMAAPRFFGAFPSALQRLKSGVPYDARGFNLDQSIRLIG